MQNVDNLWVGIGGYTLAGVRRDCSLMWRVGIPVLENKIHLNSLLFLSGILQKWQKCGAVVANGAAKNIKNPC